MRIEFLRVTSDGGIGSAPINSTIGAKPLDFKKIHKIMKDSSIENILLSFPITLGGFVSMPTSRIIIEVGISRIVQPLVCSDSDP